VVVGDTAYVGTVETAQVVAIPINDDGTAGTPTTFVQHDSPVDGVAVDAAGNIYSTHPFVGEVRRVNADGDIEVIANLDDGLDGPTSVDIGPGAEGETAYIANWTGVLVGGELGAGPSIVSVPTAAAEGDAEDTADAAEEQAEDKADDAEEKADEKEQELEEKADEKEEELKDAG
jgi:hypothetical protein